MDSASADPVHMVVAVKSPTVGTGWANSLPSYVNGYSGFISGRERCLGLNGCLLAENAVCSLTSGRG